MIKIILNIVPKYCEYISHDFGLGNIRTNPPRRSNWAFADATIRCCSIVNPDLLILLLLAFFFLCDNVSAECTLLY